MEEVDIIRINSYFSHKAECRSYNKKEKQIMLGKIQDHSRVCQEKGKTPSTPSSIVNEQLTVLPNSSFKSYLPAPPSTKQSTPPPLRQREKTNV